MRHDCTFCCGVGHGPLLGPPEHVGRPAFGTCDERRRRREANKRARRARKANR